MELTIEEALQQGITAHKEGKVQAAELLYRAIIQSQPAHPDANHNLGILAVSANKAELALPLFETALEANPKIEQFWLSYIDALIKEKQFETAKQIIQQAKTYGVAEEKLNILETQLTPTAQINKPKLAVKNKSLSLSQKRKKLSEQKKQRKAKTQNLKANNPSQQQISSLLEYYQNGRFAEAEKLAVSITQEFPTHQFGWKVLGAVLAQTGRKSEAVDANQKAIALSPQDADAHNNLGITLQQLGRLDEAEASYTQAIALKPDYAEAHSNLGNTLKELGRLDEAEASYKQAIALKPDHAEAHSNLGGMLQELGRLDEAEASCTKAIALTPNFAEDHYNLGNTLQQLDRLDEAKASYTQAIALKSDYAPAHNNLGITLKELGKLDESEASYTQAIALKPDYAEAHYNLGITLQELGRLNEAEVSFRQAIALKSDYAEAHSNLGNTLQELGRLNEAEASHTQAITLKPDFAEAHYNLGNTLQELGRLDESEVSYKQAIALKPDYAEAHSNLGGILQELGRLDEAGASYKQAMALKPDYVDSAQNFVKLPVGKLDSDTLDLCEKMFCVPGDSLELKIKYYFFRGYLLKHRGLMEQSFNNFCKANKLKLEDNKDKIMIEAKQNTDHLVRIKKWVPSIPDLTRDRLTKIFIMGPSRSGKSYAEHVLSESSHVKTFFEYIRNTEVLKNNYYEKDSGERLFQNLFSQNEAQLFHQQYKAVTSTNPESIFYSDYLVDMLPNTYFIIVKRDPRDVSSEIFTKEYLQGNLYSHDPSDISKYLDVYNEICETLSLKIPDRFLIINFEEIIKAPDDFLDRVSKFVKNKFEVKHLKRNIGSYKSESAFRNYYADMNRKYF